MCFRKIIIGLLGFSLVMPVLANEVNVYSARKENLIKPLFDQFTADTGIKVNLLTGKADALIKKLELEGKHSPADLFVVADAGRLHRAKAADLLQVVESATLQENIPINLRDTDNTWFGVTLRARPIFYVTANVDPAELSTYEGLTDPRWQGQICIRSSNNIYNQSLVASMIAAHGVARTQEWADKFITNLARSPKGGDRDQIKAAAAGQCDIAIANTYYYAQMIEGNDKSQQEAAAKLSIFWPNQDDRGTHVNISGIALTKASKNQQNAIKLMEYMTRDAAQTWYANANGEYPVKTDIQPSELLQSWGEFKADSLNLSQLGINNAEAIKIMDKAGWQ